MKRFFVVLTAALLLACLAMVSAGCAEGWPPTGKSEGEVYLSSDMLSGIYLCNYEGKDGYRGSGSWFHFGGIRTAGDNSGSGKDEPATAARIAWVSGDESLKNVWEFDLSGSIMRCWLGDLQADGKEAVLRAEFESEHYYASVEFSMTVVDFGKVGIQLDAEIFDAAQGQPWSVDSEILSKGVHLQPDMYYYGSIRDTDGELETENEFYRIDSGSRVTVYQPGSYTFSLFLNLARNCVMVSRPVTLNVQSQEEANAAWEAAWPPEGKIQGHKTDTNNHSNVGGVYFINGDYNGIGTAPRYLAAGDNPEEVIEEYHVTFLSGDENLRSMISQSTYGGSRDEANLHLDWYNVQNPGKAEFRIDMASEHYWASETVQVEIMDGNSVTTKLSCSDVNVPVGQAARLADLFETRQFVVTDPSFEYSCSVYTPEEDYNAETEDYELRYGNEFTAKKAGDYAMQLRVYIDNGLSRQFPITVHASEETTAAAVAGEAPLSEKALRKEQEERQRIMDNMEAGKEEGDTTAETEDAIWLYRIQAGEAVIKGVYPQGNTLTVPAELNGTKVSGISDYMRCYSGRGELEKLVISEGIRTIGAGAFTYQSSLKKVQLPESLTAIGDSAFNECRELKEINLPAGLALENIGDRAFGAIGAEDLTLADGTSLMAASLAAYRTGGKNATGFIMSSVQSNTEYLVREDGCAVAVGHYTDYWGDPETLKVPEVLGTHPVREIGPEAFAYRNDFRTAILPEGLEVIGEKAFYKCESLTQVTIPTSVKEIGSKAFYGIGTTELALPEGSAASVAGDWFAGGTEKDSTGKWSYQILADGTAAITGYEFAQKLDFPAEVDGIPVTVIERVEWYSGIEEDRQKVRQVTIPDTVKALGEEVFINMTKLAKVTLPSGLREIGTLAFDNTGLTEITIPEGIAEIPEKAFASCSALKKVKLPSTLRTIGSEAFRGCKLTALTLPEGLEKIGSEAFRYNELKELEIPESVQEIGYAAFAPNGQTTLKKVTFRGVSTELGKGIFGYDSGFNAYINAHPEERGSGRINYDFSDQKNWTDYYADISSIKVSEITISCYPGSTADNLYIWNVKKNYLKWDESHVLTLPADPVLKKGLVSNEDLIYELIIPEGVEEVQDYALTGIKTLCKVSLPSTLKKIGMGSFMLCSSLQEITLPKGVTEIGESAFSDCISLKKINLPEGISEIPDMAFMNCLKLEKVTWPKTGLIRIGKDAFEYCAQLKDAQFGKKLEEIGEFAFYGSGLTKAMLPDTVTKLGEAAFAGTKITALTLSKGLNEIPNLLCYQCYSLKTVKIPAGITRIGDGAFMECESLTGVTLPEGLLSIGNRAFMQDVEMVQAYYGYFGGKKKATALASLKLPASLQTIGENAFTACDSLTAVTFAKNAALTEIGKQAFGMCIRLKEIKLPDSVQTIGESVFVNCIEMKKADLGKGVVKAGGTLFQYCSQMTQLTVPATLTEIGPQMLEDHGEKLAVICEEGSAMDAYLRENYPEVTVRRK